MTHKRHYLLLVLTCVFATQLALTGRLSSHAQQPEVAAEGVRQDQPTATLITAPNASSPALTTTGTPILPLTVDRFSPTTITNDQATKLTLYGSGFTDQTQVSLAGIGTLSPVSTSPTMLTVEIPANVRQGTYALEVRDPVTGMTNAPGILSVAAVQPTASPTATTTHTPTRTPTPSPTASPSPTTTQTALPLQVPTVTAQPSQTPLPPIEIADFEPKHVTSGEAATLSVYGAHFRDSTIVRLVGFGLLQTTRVNINTLSAAIPAGIPAGAYTVQVSDPTGGTQQFPDVLTVSAPPLTPAPPPSPMPTPLPPTPVPGEPMLIVSNYTANPRAIRPGQAVNFTAEVVNIGNRAAQGISLRIDSGSSIIPASDQANVLLPDLSPGARYTLTLRASAAVDAGAGSITVPVTLTYRDFEGRTLNSAATWTVTVLPVLEESQVMLASYAIEPPLARPGEAILIRATISNTGSTTARQAALQINTADRILLAGPQGDSFPLGDIPAGGEVVRELPLILSLDAQPGPQSQSIVITFLQNGDPRQTNSSITVDVAQTEETDSLILLEAYDTGQETVQPGDVFTLTMTLKNVGTAKVNELLVTFGRSGSDGNDDNGKLTLSNTTFAALGSGGAIYAGEIAANGGTIDITQAFIVSGSVDSGIYQLPITLRYTKPDGTVGEETVSAGVIVVKPPRLMVRTNPAMPETVWTSELVTLDVQLINVGQQDANLTFAYVEAENADIVEGVETFIGRLPYGETTTLETAFIPLETGPVSLTVRFEYVDDLNRSGNHVETFNTRAELPPRPTPDPDITAITPEPVVTPTPNTDGNSGDIVGRFLLGLLGLGS